MRTFIVILAVSACVRHHQPPRDPLQQVQEGVQARVLVPVEEAKRFRNFVENMMEARAVQDEPSYLFGMNEFSD